MDQNRFSLNKTFIFIFFVLCCSSCNDKNNKGYFRHTSVICNNVYLEVYVTSQNGAFGGEMLCQYLTDSTTYRVRVGKFDESDEFYSYKCNGDSILIQKSYKSDTSKVYRIIETNNYKIEDLKNLKNISNPTITNISKK